MVSEVLEYTPVYLRYNTGLHISENGQSLSRQLSELIRSWPVPVEDIAVIAFSMGGLLIRSACHYGKQDDQLWLGLIKKIVFLGTPHHGAPLAKASSWLDLILGSTPYTKPFVRLSQLRSAGMTDLRYGYVRHEQWMHHEKYESGEDRRDEVSLPKGIHCYTVAATVAKNSSPLAERLLGDGLVPLHSALGEHKALTKNLAFGGECKRTMYGMNHMELIKSAEVAEQCIEWLSGR